MFSESDCSTLLDQIRNFEAARWFHRSKINSKPVNNDGTSDYYFCGDRQQPREFRSLLWSLAPKIDTCILEEACVNWYPVNGYMPSHQDISLYRYNIVVPLQALGDGVIVNDVFHTDVVGRGLVFPAKSAPHSVPPVKQDRYCLIFLYM